MHLETTLLGQRLPAGSSDLTVLRRVHSAGGLAEPWPVAWQWRQPGQLCPGWLPCGSVGCTEACHQYCHSTSHVPEAALGVGHSGMLCDPRGPLCGLGGAWGKALQSWCHSPMAWASRVGIEQVREGLGADRWTLQRAQGCGQVT